MLSAPAGPQPLIAVALAQNVELIIGSDAIQPIFQSQSVAWAGVMPEGRYTYTRKTVAVISYWYDPPVACQWLLEPARLLETIGALVKPHPEMSTSR